MSDRTSRLKKLSEILADINYGDLETKNDRNAYFTLKNEKAELEKELGYKELVG